MSMIDYGISGVKRQSLRKGTPRNFVAKLLEKRVDEEEILEQIEAAILKDADFRRAVAEYWFAGERRNLIRAPRPSYHERQKIRKEAVVQRQLRVAPLVEVAKARIKEKLLDMEINGKRLRDYTFGELGKLGGKFTSLSKGGKPNEKVGKLSETEVRKLFRATT